MATAKPSNSSRVALPQNSGGINRDGSIRAAKNNTSADISSRIVGKMKTPGTTHSGKSGGKCAMCNG